MDRSIEIGEHTKWEKIKKSERDRENVPMCSGKLCIPKAELFLRYCDYCWKMTKSIQNKLDGNSKIAMSLLGKVKKQGCKCLRYMVFGLFSQ